MSESIDRLEADHGLVITLDPNAESAPITCSLTEEEIPVERLTPTNPVLGFTEVHFFDDELEDCGQVSSVCRFRYMADCMYALVRYYVRVDNVVVRILDTRIFLDYKENKFIREFWHKESTYDELRARGFNLGSEWGISQQQADMVFGHLKQVQRTREVVEF